MLTCTVFLILANAFVTTIAVSGSTEEEIVQIFQGLKAESKEYKEKLINLENKILSQNEYILDQDKRIKSLENIIKSQKSDLIPQRDGEQHDNQSLERILDERIKKDAMNSVPRSLTTAPVAFQAFLSHDTFHIAKHQVIMFDSVVTNIGGGYHSRHGLFTAPKAGVYIFSSSLLVQPNSGIEGQIMKNGRNIQGVLANSRIHKDYVQGSGTAVVQLGIGDEVWVETTEWTHDAALRMDDYTSFMGCLIFEL